MSSQLGARAQSQRNMSLPDRRAPRRQQNETLSEARNIIIWLRWTTLVVAAILIFSDRSLTTATAVSFAALAAHNTMRTAKPITYSGSEFRFVSAVLLDVCVGVAAVLSTGYWQSPFYFCLTAVVVVAAVARGLAFALRVAVVTAVVIAVPYHLAIDGASVSTTITLGSELVFIGLLSGYANKMFGEADRKAKFALSRLGQLTEVNSLLLNLSRAARDLPVSLDMQQTTSGTLQRIHELMNPDMIVVFLRDDATATWTAAITDGCSPSLTDDGSLPSAVSRSLSLGGPVCVYAPTEMLSPTSRTAVYAPLLARGELIGALAIETDDTDAYSDDHLPIVDGMAEYAALAIDNARWFSRLRTIGAEEERLRLARDLHDQVGQSVAFLAFELDRIAEKAKESSVHDDLETLRRDARKVVTDVRNALYDLRTEVTEASDLPATITEFLERVASRSGLHVNTDFRVESRPPLTKEQELWRIAREAIVNVERHANATTVTVRYAVNRAGVTLEVEDDGSGFTPTAGRPDSFGIVGMRERADAIGATLAVTANPGTGSTVRCIIGEGT